LCTMRELLLCQTRTHDRPASTRAAAGGRSGYSSRQGNNLGDDDWGL
jgi:hypothetical protein